MQTFNQLFFKKKQIFSYFFKEISDLDVFDFSKRCLSEPPTVDNEF